jgi:transposase
MREDQLAHHAAGEPTTVSASSIRRWQQRLIPHRQTGNRENTCLRGFHQILLSTFVFAYPEATLDKIATFIANSSDDGIIYSRHHISERLKQLGLSRKRASTEANQASLSRNVLIRQMFWTMPAPIGIFGTPRWRFIDVDEAGFTLEKSIESTEEVILVCGSITQVIMEGASISQFSWQLNQDIQDFLLMSKEA